MIISTQLQEEHDGDKDVLTHCSQVLIPRKISGFLHGGLGDILHAQQWVSAVWTAQDTGGENDGQRIWRHAVVGLHFTNSARAFR